MALIFAFKDETGEWHGSPDMPLDYGRPGEAQLDIPSADVDPAAAACRFAGQRLQVLFASIDPAIPGPVPYPVSNGRSYYSTDEVYEELGCYEPTLLDEPSTTRSARTPVEPEPVTLELDESGHIHRLTLTSGGDDRLAIELDIFDEHGAEIARVQGTLPERSMARAGRLLLSAATARLHRRPGDSQVRPFRATRRGEWTAEEEDLLRALSMDGQTVEAIAAEMGRTVNSIRWKQHQYGLGPFPSDLVEPAATKPPPAYTMEDLRREHRNSHKRWTREDDALLARRSREGASVEDLMQEFGRNYNAITSRLSVVRDEFGNDSDKAEAHRIGEGGVWNG